MKREELLFYLPHSLAVNLENCLISTGELNLAKYHIDKFRYILDYIYCQRTINKKYSIDDYIPLNSDILDKLFGGSYAWRILKWLIKYEILERDNQSGYSNVTHQSYRYRLTGKYRYETHRLIWSSDTRFARKILNYRAQKRKERAIIDRKLEESLKKIEIKSQEAIDYCISRLLSERGIVYNFDILHSSPLSTIDLFKQIEALYNIIISKETDGGQLRRQNKEFYGAEEFVTDILSICRIADKNFHYSVDKTSQRRHTNITSLRTGLRQFLLLDSKPLIELDIANSQPLIFGVNLMMYYKKRHIPIPKDGKLFIKECEDGVFYNNLMDELLIDESKRKDFKRKFFGNVFFNETPHYTTPYTDLFKKKFPNVWTVIVDMKKKNYKELAIKLQKKEVEIMIEEAVKGVQKLIPKVDLLTIHDSICFFDESLIDPVKAQIEKAFFRYNISPTVKERRYTTEHDQRQAAA